MRRKKQDLRARINGDLQIDFAPENQTSYGGLELMIRYKRMIDWIEQPRHRHHPHDGRTGQLCLAAVLPAHPPTHNLPANFQIETGPRQRQRTPKCTARWALKTARILRFERFHRAGRLVRTGGRTILRLKHNVQVEARSRHNNEMLGLAA